MGGSSSSNGYSMGGSSSSSGHSSGSGYSTSSSGSSNTSGSSKQITGDTPAATVLLSLSDLPSKSGVTDLPTDIEGILSSLQESKNLLSKVWGSGNVFGGTDTESTGPASKRRKVLQALRVQLQELARAGDEALGRGIPLGTKVNVEKEEYVAGPISANDKTMIMLRPTKSKRGSAKGVRTATTREVVQWMETSDDQVPEI